VIQERKKTVFRKGRQTQYNPVKAVAPVIKWLCFV